jgi:pentatricopeptide repeat protein
MYISCDDISMATEVFAELGGPKGCTNISIWNMIFSAYITNNKLEKAEELYRLSNVTLGREIQHDSERYNVERTVQLDTALLNMLAKTNCLKDAENQFIDMKRRGNLNTASWNVLLSGYIQNDQLDNAVRLYQQMQREHVAPNDRTFSIMLTAAAQQAHLSLGKAPHEQIISMQLPYSNHLFTALINMYSKW